MSKKKIAAIIAAGALVAGLGACAQTDGGEAPEGGAGNESQSLTVYYGTPRDVIAPLFDKFRELHPDIAVEEFRQPTEELMSTLQLELRGGNSRADVVISSAAQLEALDAEVDAFQAYETADAAEVNPTLMSENGHINPLGVNLYMIAYNSDIIAEEDAPTSFADLLDPRWQDQIAIADPSNSASIHSFIYHMTNVLSEEGEPYGWEYFDALGQLNPRLEASHGTIRDLVLTGERPIGLLLTEHIPALDADPAGAWVWPTESLPAEPLGVGITAGTQHLDAAQIFLDYIHSDEGQLAASEGIGLMPVRADLDFAFADGVTVADLDVVGVDSAYIATHREEQAAEFHERMGTR